MGLQAAQVAHARRQRLWITFGLVLMMLIMACAALGVWVYSSFVRNTPLLGGKQTNLTQGEIESLARIILPPSTHNLHAEVGGFQDLFIHVRFDINPADLPKLGGSRYWPALDPTGATGVPFQAGIEPKRPWWQPQQAQQFQSGYGGSDGINQSVLIDTTDPNNYVVYVETFET